MKRNVFTMIGVLTVIAISGLGALTSYATGSGATEHSQETETTHVSITTYNQAKVKSLGAWEQQSDGTWKFKCFNGSYLVNSWIESLSEAEAFYFVGSDGTMLTNTVTPDNYTIDSTGLWKIGKAYVPAITETQAPAPVETSPVESVPVETVPQNMDKDEFDALQEYYESQNESMENNEELMNAIKDNAKKLYGD